MQNSLEVARKLKAFLDQMGTNLVEPDAQLSLQKDKQYMEKSIAILSSDDADSINGLWREVQYLSRFFGGDYAQGSDQSLLLQLMDEFGEALLDDIVSLRRIET